ncbi:hypothetical protein O181_002379 [Austropuccinia psidii MF-1]|uniref:Uncharacterized protein n=1 Tax=Austropuccinia psidii MF-1 TaxID=1389203 RepID=A0A9Q3BCB0_9BASI|nr:hypothetical protein [Austropuccinia psidii MF-1]
MHLCLHLISSAAYHAYAPALPSHVLNLLSYAHEPSLPADHDYTYTKDWLSKHHLQISTDSIVILPHHHLIFSEAYHAYTLTLPPHVLNFPSICSQHEWLPHQGLFISPIDHS